MAEKTEEDFIRLVRQAEVEAASNPRSYTLKVALFALLGYLVIFAVLAGLLGLAGGVIASALFSTALFLLLLKKKLIIAVLFAIWVLLKALWVKFDPPRGYRLKRGEFPELFAQLDDLRKQLKSLKIHAVILDRSLNASVYQHPRLGVLGWYKNYLILGYQLMLALSPEEMRSVLAHELGHLSGNHSRFGGWIYRVRQTWRQVMSAFGQVDSWGAKLMCKFFDWYSPRFEAYSFALARSNEYMADAISAELTSPEIATRALVSFHASAPYVDERYWESFFLQADEFPEPRHAPFEGLRNFLDNNPLTREEMLQRIQSAMEMETGYADTHPSLKDRVAALGASPQLPRHPEQSAAQAWLGERNRQVMGEFDRQWLAETGESWKERHEYVRNGNIRLAEYAKKNAEALSDQELWEFACLSEEFHSAATALPLFRAYQARYPEDPDPAYFIGRTLLQRGDDAGLEQLRLACDNPKLIEQATYTGYDYLKRKGDEAAAEAWWRTSSEKKAVFIAAQQERDRLDRNDVMIPAQLDDARLQRLIASLKRHKKVGKAWLAQKQIKHFPENPVYVLAFVPKGINLQSASRLQQQVADVMDIDETCFVVCKAGDGAKFARKVIKAGQRIL